ASALSADFADTIDVLERGVARGLHLGAQLYVSVDRQPQLDIAVGESRRGASMQTDTLVPWLSAGKPVVAVAIAPLVRDGHVRLDDRVTTFVPEFGQRDKHDATVAHLLSHVVAFDDDVPHDMLLYSSRDEIIDWICARPLKAGARPGTAASYSYYAAWYVLGE